MDIVWLSVPVLSGVVHSTSNARVCVVVNSMQLHRVDLHVITAVTTYTRQQRTCTSGTTCAVGTDFMYSHTMSTAS